MGHWRTRIDGETLRREKRGLFGDWRLNTSVGVQEVTRVSASLEDAIIYDTICIAIETESGRLLVVEEDSGFEDVANWIGRRFDSEVPDWLDRLQRRAISHPLEPCLIEIWKA